MSVLVGFWDCCVEQIFLHRFELWVCRGPSESLGPCGELSRIEISLEPRAASFGSTQTAWQALLGCLDADIQIHTSKVRTFEAEPPSKAKTLENPNVQNILVGLHCSYEELWGNYLMLC